MDDEWLSAAETMRRVEAVMGPFTAPVAIATRALDGLIRTKAERFIKGDQTSDDVELPTKFWWASGHAALEQNWVSGDFETWIDQREHWKAYGVRFLRLHIEKMLPEPGPRESASGAGATSSEHSPEQWLSARDATLRIARATDQDATAALYSIIAYAKTGHIRARAMVFREVIGDRQSRKETEHRDASVPIWFWENCTDYDSCALNWQSGIFAGKGYLKGKSVSANLTGVQFESSGVDLLDPRPQPAPSSNYPGGLTWVDAEYDPHFAQTDDETSERAEWGGSKGATVESGPRPRGGRPPAEWWDDLWVEICRQLYSGDLQPTKQSDIEDAMHQWLLNRGDSAASSTVRARARKLWMAIEVEDEN